jgi:hypothetical protein
MSYATAWTVAYANLAIANKAWLTFVSSDPKHQVSWLNAAVREGIVYG